MAEVVQRLVSFWKRQMKSWRVVVTRAIFNRFFIRLTMDYTNIYVRALGATPLQLGSLNSVTHLASTVISGPLGWIQDRYSLKKYFIISIGLFIFVPLIYALAQDWIWIIPAMFLTIFSWPCQTICDVCLKKRDRATGKSLCEVVGSIPSLSAPTIAAFLIAFFGGISVKGIRPLYWIQFAGQCIVFLFVYTTMTEVNRHEKRKMEFSFVGDFREVFERGTALKRWIIVSTLSMFITSLTSPFRAPFAHEIKGADQFVIGGMASASLVVQILFATPLGRLADNIGRKKVFYALAPLYWASNLLLVFAPTPELLILSGVLLGFQNIVSIAVLASIRAELVPVDCLGRWRGILSLFGGLASITASIMGGLIWETFGPAYIFLLPVVIDLLVRIPTISSIPETLTLELKE
jgi:MFS family permease